MSHKLKNLWFFCWGKSMNDSIKFYGQFTKKDDDERTVEGYASTEAIDTQGEVVKTEAIEKALPDYLKWGNVREMHQWSAVGKTIVADVDKVKKGLFIKAKIVDPIAWQKCKEGVYNAFSIGGKVLKRVGNVIQDLVLNEISIVDRPANPEAIFTLVKFDKGGAIMDKSYDTPTAPTSMEEAVSYPGIKIADRLIASATQLTYLIEECVEMKRPVKHLEKIVQALKMAALFELQAEKVACEKTLLEQQLSQKEKVQRVKNLVEKALTYKGIDTNWAESYFENLRKVL